MNRGVNWKVSLAAVASSALTFVAMRALAVPSPAHTTELDNARVTVTRVEYQPGVPRERFTRQHDQVIVFLDDCAYERIDSTTHEKTIRRHKSGDVIWHNKGEDAPVLTNVGNTLYRTLVVELK